MKNEKLKENVQIGVVLNKELVELIDHYAKRLDRSRSEMARNLIIIGLDDAKLIERFGIFKLRELIKEVMKEKTGQVAMQ